MPQLGPTRRQKAVACAVALITTLGATFQDEAPTTIHPLRLLLAGASLAGLAALAALWPIKKRKLVVIVTTSEIAPLAKKYGMSVSLASRTISSAVIHEYLTRALACPRLSAGAVPSLHLRTWQKCLRMAQASKGTAAAPLMRYRRRCQTRCPRAFACQRV
jgi:hypothetical protein